MRPKKLLDAMVSLAVQIDFDKDKFSKVKWILSNLRGQFKTKAFVQELLEQSSEHYIAIKKFLGNLNNYCAFDYMGTHFYLTHWNGSINPAASYRLELPHATASNTTYIFGHEPVPQLHRLIQNNCSGFDFDYRKVFSWIDTSNNRYYHLDLASNPIVALKLDDMSQYYAGIPTKRKNAKKWEVPENVTETNRRDYEYIENAQIGIATFKNAAIVTRDNGCYEFIIGISSFSKCIYYARVSWLDYQHSYVIEDWLDGHSIEEIIEKVREDFKDKRKTPEGQYIEAYLRGESIE